MTTPEIDRIVVVIPAHDEEALLNDAIAAVNVAAERVEPQVEIVVVANGCRDRTVDVAAQQGAHVITRAHANVGAARAAGARWAEESGDDSSVSGLWLACTDADSRVPPHWLSAQLQCAAAGFGLFLGTVCLADSDVSGHRAWVDRYAADRLHVHGANLGVRATAYRAVGGFRPLLAHEDVDLADRLRHSGVMTLWHSDVAVTTSARWDPRACEGVGADLARARLA